MANLRFLLFFALAVVLLLIYQAWMRDYGHPVVPPERTVQRAPVLAEEMETSVLSDDTPDTSEIPDAPVPAVTAKACLLYTSPSPRDGLLSRMPSSA